MADLEERVRMQPTATASIPPPADMDLQTMQSMDWLFKKERIYLLAQFWQQVSTSLLIIKSPHIGAPYAPAPQKSALMNYLSCGAGKSRRIIQLVQVPKVCP